MHSFLRHNEDPVVRTSSTYIEVVQKRVRQLPDHVVYRFLDDGVNESELLTYGMLDTEARSIGAALQRLAQKGDRVLMLYPPGLDFISGLFACYYTGMVAVPAYPPRRNRGINRLLAIIEDADARLCLVTRSIYHDIQRHFKDAPWFDQMKWIVHEDALATSASEFSAPDIRPEDLAFLQYTSGSTGQPKGVMITQLNLLYNSEYIRLAFHLDTNTIGMHWLPAFHDMGLIGGILQVAYLGAVNVGMPPMAFLRNPINYLNAIQTYRSTTGGGPNFLYDHCLQRIDEETQSLPDLSSMTVLYNGAETIRPETMDRFSERMGVRKSQYLTCYGLAEATLIVTGIDQDKEPQYRWIDREALSKNQVKFTNGGENSIHVAGCGHTRLETELIIADPHTYDLCGDECIGEIWIKGPTVAQGYWQNPESTTEVFQAFTKEGQGPYMRTGDLGFLHEGELYVTGRLKDLIIIRGVNHYPNDIEYTTLRSNPAFRPNATAAFAVTKGQQEELVIVQEAERAMMSNPNLQPLVDKIRQDIAEEHEVDPVAVILIKPGSIPMTSSGKVQRRQTRLEYLQKSLDVVYAWEQPLQSVTHQHADHVPTAENLRSWLINWIIRNRHFEEKDIQTNVNIRRYGIDSLTAVTLESEISNHFGFQWHVSSFMLDPTIEGLVEEGMNLYTESLEQHP